MKTGLSRLRRAGGKSGFTLIELLIVIAVIGILMGMLNTALVKSRERGKKTQAKTEIRTLASGLRTYRHEYGHWPMDPSVITGQFPFEDDCRALIEYMRDDSHRDKNPRAIQFVTWSDYFTLNVDDERVQLLEYMESNGSADIPIVDPWGNKITITIDLDEDKATVKNNTLDERMDA